MSPMLFNKRFIKNSMLCFAFLFVSACGFHLRGSYHFSECIQNLCIEPYQPAHSFQRLLVQTLKANGIQIINDQIGIVPTEMAAPPAKLIIQNSGFTESASAIGADAQSSRSIMQLTIQYQLDDCTGHHLIPCGLIQVSRDFGVNPNTLLATDNERLCIQEELFNDAVTQFLRQLSAIK